MQKTFIILLLLIILFLISSVGLNLWFFYSFYLHPSPGQHYAEKVGFFDYFQGSTQVEFVKAEGDNYYFKNNAGKVLSFKKTPDSVFIVGDQPANAKGLVIKPGSKVYLMARYVDEDYQILSVNAQTIPSPVDQNSTPEMSSGSPPSATNSAEKE